jgi:putative transposase
MCKLFHVSRSGYYEWLRRKPSRRRVENNVILSSIKQIYKESKGRYGSPKITRVLSCKGVSVSRPRVARIMKAASIKSIIRKRYRVNTTDSKHDYPISENHLNREFQVQVPDKVWVSDITYIKTKQGWLYLTVIIDLFNRKVKGWSLSENLTARDTVVKAFSMAITKRIIKDTLLFHSDRGVQYACNEFREALAKENGVIQSMSRKGNCWDNAVAESFFKILKSEMVYHCKYETINQAKLDVFEFIEVWYNRQRKHATLDYMSPVEFENRENINKAA